jgi:uncharacterized protein
MKLWLDRFSAETIELAVEFTAKSTPSYQVDGVKPSTALILHRNEIRRLVEQSRARNPRVFGSALRGRDTESSDLDILVDPMPGTTLFDLGGLQVALEQLLGVPVDLLTPGDLPRSSRDRVLREATPV